MKIRLRIERDGEVLHTAEYEPEYEEITLAEFSARAHEEFARKRPDVSLLDDNVWLKWDKAE